MVFLTNDAGTPGHTYSKKQTKKYLDVDFILFIKIYLKWIIGLNVKLKTGTLLEETREILRWP